MGFPRQECWSGLLFPTPGDLSDPGIKPRSPALQLDLYMCRYMFGLPWWRSSEESACNAVHLDIIPGLGRSLGQGNGYPLQYSCLENSMDRGVWQAIVRGVHCTYTHIIHMLKEFSQGLKGLVNECLLLQYWGGEDLEATSKCFGRTNR